MVPSRRRAGVGRVAYVSRSAQSPDRWQADAESPSVPPPRADSPPQADRVGEQAEVAAFRRSLGLTSLIDVHTHFMPERLLAKVWAYFDAAGPLVGRPWPIAYREEERQRLQVLRGFGVRAFTSMLYPHKPGMASGLNDWAAQFAARTPDCLHTATFFAEPSAARDVRRALDQGARVRGLR